jgi:hypothetical protein
VPGQRVAGGPGLGFLSDLKKGHDVAELGPDYTALRPATHHPRRCRGERPQSSQPPYPSVMRAELLETRDKFRCSFCWGRGGATLL